MAEKPTEWLVDGFNVLHVGLGGRTRKDWWNEENRQRVIDQAARLAARGERVTIVFDGVRPAAAAPEAADSAGCPRIVFAPDADTWLLRAVLRVGG